MASARIHIPHVMSGLTLQVQVTGMAAMKIRLWLGLRMMKLAAKVMGTGIRISLDD